MPQTSLRTHPIAALTDRALVIGNPMAAKASADMVDTIGQELGSHLGDIAIAWTTRRGEALEMAEHAAEKGEVGLIVAVGGDGTVREVAEGVVRGGQWPVPRAGADADRPVVLAIPAGGGNSTCRNLWGDIGWAEVLDLALDPERSGIRSIDVLHLVEPDVCSVLGVSCGFLAAVLVAARNQEGLVGMDRYHAGAASVLAALPADPTIVAVDGTRVHEGPALLAAVGGGRYRAHTLQLLPSSVLDDGLLDVCAIGRMDAAGVLALAVQATTGDHLGRPDVRCARGHRVVMRRLDGQPLLVEYDGEVWESPGSMLTVDVLPRALRVLAPTAHPAG